MSTNRKRPAWVEADETPAHVVTRRQARAQLPPMLAPVVVRKFVKDDGARDKLVGWLLQVDAWGLIDELDAFVRVERGALTRFGAILPDPVKKAAQFGLDLCDLLREVVRSAQMFHLMPAGEGVPRVDFEKLLLGQVQQLMDRLVDAERELDAYALQSLAGIGGCDVQALRRLSASSGIEAGLQVAWCVRRAVRGQARPFLGLVAQQVKPDRRQVGRTRPASAGEMQSDDCAILKAVGAGRHTAKEVASAMVEFGSAACGAGHVRKRKMDLVKWGLLDEGRELRLTDAGHAWLQEMRPPKVGTRQT